MLLVPVGLVVFTFSLIIGHFISEPLRLLAKKTAAYRSGADVPFEPDGRLYEADELATDFKALAQTMKTQQHDLVLKERRQAAFISDVAHELRTPLTAIRGNAEMLEDPDLPPELHEKFCSIIINESERLSRLTHDLLTLQRLDDAAMPMELSRVNLRELSTGVLDALEPILRDRHANAEIIGEAPDVLGDPDRLKQAVTNLVENASRFIEPDGHITIELFGLKGNSILAVKDDGTGFGDIDPQLLFDRFYRTDASRSRGTGGTGLGLAIVKSVVEAHDGTVEAINLPDGGACFIIALPSILPGER
ncbi:sensor histidine kinase [Eggerthella guodeyinii]|uniref:Sensor-like histidine kinase SenX3 n=1 Tax=Eggerthella guodeyinii TaxID=2690837 RepID=A0A6N7RKK9_9ACTN|nr:HAMP domain-containing sensor histidine kinase [Eggerthella guodeyinii]MRX81481.1 sensor histidine kinase [Eggerthella guodeyinii]